VSSAASALTWKNKLNGSPESMDPLAREHSIVWIDPKNPDLLFLQGGLYTMAKAMPPIWEIRSGTTALV